MISVLKEKINKELQLARSEWISLPLYRWAGLMKLHSLALAATFLCLLSTGVANAHKVSAASVVIFLDTEQEVPGYRLSLAMEVESSGDEVLDDQISPEDAARIFVEQHLQLIIDDEEQPQDLKVTLESQSDEGTPEELQKMAAVVEWKAPLPEGAEKLWLFLKETADLSIVIATVRNGKTERRMQVLFPGEISRVAALQPEPESAQ